MFQNQSTPLLFTAGVHGSACQRQLVTGLQQLILPDKAIRPYGREKAKEVGESIDTTSLPKRQRELKDTKNQCGTFTTLLSLRQDRSGGYVYINPHHMTDVEPASLCISFNPV